MRRHFFLLPIILLAACAGGGLFDMESLPAVDPQTVSGYTDALADAARVRESFLYRAREAYDAGLIDEAGRERAREIGKATRKAGEAAKAVLEDYTRTGDSVLLLLLASHFVTDQGGERTRLKKLMDLLDLAAELGIKLAEENR